MRPYILAETNWNNLKDSEFELAVLPWGATEAHNYHLPYSSDVIEAEGLIFQSAEIAFNRGAKIIVLPTIPFGVNTGQTDILLNINLNPSTQFSILKDVIQVLDRQGIRKFLIFNSHGGNDFKPMVRELGVIYPGMFLCIADFYKVLDKNDYFNLDGDHADEMETSLLLYLKPDLVLDKKHWGKGTEKKINLKYFDENWIWTERKWSKITLDTGVGNPKFATREKGEKYFNALTDKIGDMLYELCKTEIDYS
jgi:creatinine amidohydrolase